MSPSFLSPKPQVIPWEHGDTQVNFIAVYRAVKLSRGHSDSIFPGCCIILFPVSGNEKAISLGTLLCGVGSGDQSLRCPGSLDPSFSETTDSPRVSRSPPPLFRGLPPCKVHTCARGSKSLQTPAVESATLFPEGRGQPHSRTAHHGAVFLLSVTVSLEHTREREVAGSPLLTRQPRRT